MATQNPPRQKSKNSGVIVAGGFDSYLGSLDNSHQLTKRKEYTMVPVVDLLIRGDNSQEGRDLREGNQGRATEGD